MSKSKSNEACGLSEDLDLRPEFHDLRKSGPRINDENEEGHYIVKLLLGSVCGLRHVSWLGLLSCQKASGISCVLGTQYLILRKRI